MSYSVDTKARKKQSSLSAAQAAEAKVSLPFQQSLITLESVCLRILETRFASAKMDTDRLYWQQRFKNIVTPISLALNEYKGPRRFHYHYRHRADDASVLTPVFEPSPLDMLAQVCDEALAACQDELVGIYDEDIIMHRRDLEHALQMFLIRYRKYKAKS
jgi:hypothetical protein